VGRSWGEHLALDDPEVNFVLVEPGCVDRRMHQDEVGILLLEPVGGVPAPMRGAIVDDPEDAARRAVRVLGHDLFHQTTEGGDAGLGLTSSPRKPALHVPGTQVLECPAAPVVALDPAQPPRPGRLHPVATDLDCGLIVGTHHQVVRSQPAALPHPLVEVKDDCGFGPEVGIPRVDPAAVAPGLESVLGQDALYRAHADGQAFAGHHLLDAGRGVPAKRDWR